MHFLAQPARALPGAGQNPALLRLKIAQVLFFVIARAGGSAPVSSSTTIFLIIIALLGYVAAFVFWMKRGQGSAAPQQQLIQQPRNASPLADMHELFSGQHVMMPRTLLRSSAERSAWLWLRHDVFPKHNVLPKMPFTRFTLLRDPALSRKWFEVLSTVYCTFTICSDAGLAIGCIDLLPPGEETRGAVGFKRRLLEQCGMHYRVITVGQLPDAHQLSMDFLGAEAGPTEPPTPEQQEERIAAVREQLHKRLEESRRNRASSGFAPFGPTDLGQDSFLAEPDDDDLLPR